jgi:hypothetical protein
MPETQDLLPRPDPTALTTEALTREVAGLTVLFDAKLGALKELHQEKFSRIAGEFVLRDAATAQLDVARQTALDAALQAQKELGAQNNTFITSIIAANAANFTKLIDGLAALMTSNTASIAGSIDDLKGRLDRGEGHGKGLRDGWGYIIGAVAVGLALLSRFVPG